MPSGGAAISLAVVGWAIGASYGGNYATGFEFCGPRGYEATGQIGEVLGFITGAALGAGLAYLRVGKRRE
jgi:hypothetical protein